jgi:beta-1,2-mannobiose phosphorylase / 1,2-beta-oligomannan phosphorylase
MTPTIVDLPNDVLRMYYAGGEQYEPDAIGIAHSYDGGLTWVKHGDPIFKPDRQSGPIGVWFDSHKVTSPHVVYRPDDGYYYLFYAAFRNTDYSSVGLARSKDGITGWERYVDNPIVDIVQGAWNCDAVYKPFAGWSEEKGEWLVWYNGRCGGLERIGVSILKGKAFGRFVMRPED